MIYSNLITIPSICPLRFKDPQLHNEAAIYPSAFSYVQKWTPSDTIHVQLLATTDMSAKVTLDLVDYDTENPFLIRNHHRLLIRLHGWNYQLGNGTVIITYLALI